MGIEYQVLGICGVHPHRRAQLLHGAAIVLPTIECSGLRLWVVQLSVLDSDYSEHHYQPLRTRCGASSSTIWRMCRADSTVGFQAINLGTQGDGQRVANGKVEKSLDLLSGDRIGMTAAIFLVVENYETHY